MTIASSAPVVSARRSRVKQIIGDFIRRRPLGFAGLLVVVAFVLVAIFAPWVAPYDPLAFSNDILVPPSPAHLMGTDQFGRDLFSRIVYGTQISLLVGICAVALGATGGAIFGMTGAYIGGALDNVFQRIVDTLMAFPMLVLSLAMVAALGASLTNVVIALAITVFPNAARITRSAVLSTKEKTFIEAAESLGYSRTRILFGHVLPNSFAPYIILATSGLGNAILAEASLSFLGLGVPPPAPSWGGMLTGSAQAYVMQAPWIAIFPGLAIATIVFAFNFFGDALRDSLDPKLH